MLQNDILSWYETSLPTQERKVRGHFSTPPQLVERILDACGYTADKDLSRIRMLDPACGSGNFLVGVASRLLASTRRASHKKQITAVQRNIWGFDPDPVACFLAEMQLRTVLVEGSQECSMQACKHGQTFPLHIHQADCLAFPWKQDANIDLFLANPPYLAMKNNDLSGYQYARQRGQADSYLLFLNLALQVVRPGGWIGLVLPDSVLARTNATLERQRLLEETTVHSLWHLSGVFPAYVGAVVIIAQKRPPPSVHQITWVRGAWPHQHERMSKNDVFVQESNTFSSHKDHLISQSLLHSQPRAELRYLLSNVQESLIGRLHAYLCTPQSMQERRFIPLDELVLIRRGEEVSKESRILVKSKPEDEQEWLPVLRGGIDLQPYTYPVAERWMPRERVMKPLERYRMPKLLVVKSTGRLQAALDLRSHVVLQTLYLLCPRTDDINDLYFLLALLNSRLLQQYVSVLYTAYKWVQPQIEQHVLANLPIPTLVASAKVSIGQRAHALLSACSEMKPVVELNEHYMQVYEEQERAICALYEKFLPDY